MNPKQLMTNKFFTNEAKGAAYFPLRKCASSSIQSLMGNETILPGQIVLGTFRFTFVRNPFDRLVALYEGQVSGQNGFYVPLSQYGISKGMPFAGFVRRICRTQDKTADSHVCSMTYRLPLVHYIGFYENLHDGWEYIMMRTDLDVLPHIGQSRRKPWPTYYTPELMTRVFERYKRDFVAFYPEYKEEHL